MASIFDNLSASEVTHRLVDEQSRLGTESIPLRIEELCGPLASRNELGTAELTEVTGSKQGDTTASPADYRYDRLAIFLTKSNMWLLMIEYE